MQNYKCNGFGKVGKNGKIFVKHETVVSMKKEALKEVRDEIDDDMAHIAFNRAIALLDAHLRPVGLPNVAILPRLPVSNYQRYVVNKEQN